MKRVCKECEKSGSNSPDNMDGRSEARREGDQVPGHWLMVRLWARGQFEGLVTRVVAVAALSTARDFTTCK